jgi:hypothetical protein
MGKLTRQRYAALDSLIADRGEDWMLEEITDGIAEGASHGDLACRLGLSPYILREWIEANCAKDVELAYRARADMLIDAAERTVAEATGETLGVDKLRVDYYTKQAGRLDRSKYGEKVQVEINQTISVLDALTEARGRLLEGVATEIVPALTINEPEGISL